MLELGLGWGFWEGLDYSQLFGVYAGIMLCIHYSQKSKERFLNRKRDVLWQQLVLPDSAA